MCDGGNALRAELSELCDDKAFYSVVRRRLTEHLRAVGCPKGEPTLTCCVAFWCNFAAFCATWSATLIFGMISALAHVLLGQVKTCSVVVVGAVFYDAHQTTGGIFGAALALASITVYSLLKLPGPSKAEAARPLTQAAEGDSEDEEGRLGR